jgi:hypothetical protein
MERLSGPITVVTVSHFWSVCAVASLYRQRRMDTVCVFFDGVPVSDGSVAVKRGSKIQTT